MLYEVYTCNFYAGARLVEDGKATVSDVFHVSYSPTLSPSQNFHYFSSCRHSYCKAIIHRDRVVPCMRLHYFSCINDIDS